MDLIKIKDHFYSALSHVEVKSITKFINILIDLQHEGIIDKDLKENLDSYFFKKQELIELALSLGGK